MLGDLLRANMLPEAWISAGHVRSGANSFVTAKFVGFRSSLKAQVHAVIAEHGLAVPMSDVFDVGERRLLTYLLVNDVWFRSAYEQRIESLLVLIDAVEHEVDELSDSIRWHLRDNAGYHAINNSPGSAQ